MTLEEARESVRMARANLAEVETELLKVDGWVNHVLEYDGSVSWTRVQGGPDNVGRSTALLIAMGAEWEWIK